MNRIRTAIVTSTAVAAVLLAGPARADNSYGDTYGSVDEQEKTISAGVGGVVFDHSNNGSGSDVGGMSPPANWSPPPCWYAPKYTPKQLKKAKEKVWSGGSTGHQWDADQRKRYVEGEPYTNFNMKKSGDGYWWGSYVDKSFPPGWKSCEEPYFWVDDGEPPPADIPNAITPEILAELAYAEIQVPSTTVELSPATTQKVNLPTWIWLDQATFNPVSVTARVPVLDLYATTTATPVSLRIEPGTEDAKLHPTSGECPINEDGSIGTPYTKGNSEKTPPCGLTYLRSSGDGTYPLQATLTWEISWEGTGNTGGDLPDGTFGTTQNITVDEIQSIVR